MRTVGGDVEIEADRSGSEAFAVGRLHDAATSCLAGGIVGVLEETTDVVEAKRARAASSEPPNWKDVAFGFRRGGALADPNPPSKALVLGASLRAETVRILVGVPNEVM
jgi:hypothetical protein